MREVKELQSQNAPPPIDWRLEGKVRELKDLQPQNAPPPIDWRLEGKVREVKELQFQYLQVFYYQLFTY